jgi:hypothetical protein
MDKEEIINLIKGRIEVECRKHAKLDWSRIAAGKIYTEWFEYFDNENQELKAKISELEKSDSAKRECDKPNKQD